jgi:ABC-2 type transport system permease protein
MFVVIFGPLIIMLLVGFAFNNPASSKLNIGYYSKEKTNLTSSFVDALTQNQGFNIVEYTNEELCKDMIAQGKLHMCIVFPTNFKLSNNNTNEVVFYVDQSRQNFVYAVIDTVSSKIDVTSNQLSYQLTSDILTAVLNAKKINNENILKIITLKDSANEISTKLDGVKTKLGNLDLSASTIDTAPAIDASNKLKTDITNLKDDGLNVVSAGEQVVRDLKNQNGCSGNCTSIVNSFNSTLGSRKDDITHSSNASTVDLEALVAQIDKMSTDADALNEKLTNAKSATTESAGDLGGLQTAVAGLKTDLDGLKQAMEKANAQINAIKVTSAENIVNPITTTVTPITTKTNNLHFIFPYLVVLIIVFISIMLSSNIIMVEKTSKAYFRNFTTPTKDFTFVVSVFLTSFIVVILQLIFILLLAYYFLNTSILTNIWMVLLLVVGAITLFTLIGMIIGYLFNSQEAATMASISVGSVFLFLSNLVLPLETMSAYLQSASRYNPYVVGSELLKKITIFGSGWKEISMDFALLGIYIVVAFALAILIQKMSKIQYISKKPLTKQFTKKEEIIDKYFKLKSGVLVRDEKELLDELKKMSDGTFSQYVDSKKNDFESWLLMNNQNDLAKKIGKSRNRKEMIESIEKYNGEITGLQKK